MAKTNYQMVRRRKEAERKTRRDNKVARRQLKGPDEPSVAGGESADGSTTLPSENAPK